MKVTRADFVISAVNEKQYPTDQLPEIALAGRSNVGKSSFINKMIQRKNLARTSAKPGKTQTLNYYQINEQFYFVDVPGYGYAKVSKQDRQKWATMMENYFENRNVLQAVFLIIDIRHEPTETDIQMYNYLKYHQLPVVVIATKLDKIAKGKRKKQLQSAIKALELEKEDPIIPFSSQTGEGKKEAWQLIKSFL